MIFIFRKTKINFTFFSIFAFLDYLGTSFRDIKIYFYMPTYFIADMLTKGFNSQRLLELIFKYFFNLFLFFLQVPKRIRLIVQLFIENSLSS